MYYTKKKKPNTYTEPKQTFNAIKRNDACASIVGTREYQQDSVKTVRKETINGEVLFCVLADGMGGLSSGDIASRYCTSKIINDFYYSTVEPDITNFLINEIHKLNSIVSEMRNNDDTPLNCGCTLIELYINTQTGEMHWASVGDSRIYIVRQRKCIALTNDHTYYYELLQKVNDGLITLSEAETDPQKEALTSFIGLPEITQICSSAQAFKLEPGDVIIACSDGLYRTLTKNDIVEITDKRNEDAYLTAHTLVVSSLDRAVRGHDNTTAAVYFHQ